MNIFLVLFECSNVPEYIDLNRLTHDFFNVFKFQGIVWNRWARFIDISIPFIANIIATLWEADLEYRTKFLNYHMRHETSNFECVW